VIGEATLEDCNKQDDILGIPRVNYAKYAYRAIAE
jgi:hypothetical protein